MIKATLLRVLEGNYDIFKANVWVRNILINAANNGPTWPLEWTQSFPKIDYNVKDNHPVRQRLNASQKVALDAMLSPTYPTTIIQGPPGTGKTSVIAAFVQTALDLEYSGIWLVAQSNVAVKNIAEKLIKTGFLDWRLLVSTDFKVGWYVN